MKVTLSEYFIGAVIILVSSIHCVHAQSPNELDAFFTKKDADLRLSQIKSGLSSFGKLTDTIQDESNLNSDYGIPVIYTKRIPEEARITVTFKGKTLKAVDNLDWDIQHIGFENWPKYVEGYIEYLELKNMKLQLEIAKLRELSNDEITNIKKDIKEKERSMLQEYLGETSWVD